MCFSKFSNTTIHRCPKGFTSNTLNEYKIKDCANEPNNLLFRYAFAMTHVCSALWLFVSLKR